MGSMYDRPKDEFTIAERRIELASLAGPLRALMSEHREHSLAVAPSPPVIIAENRTGMSNALYVEIRPRAGVPAPVILVSSQPSVDPSGCVTVDLNVEPFKFGQVILPGERLFVRNPSLQVAIRFLVFVVRV